MTETSLAATSVSTGDFRLGSVISRSASMLWRHFPSFFLVGLMASSPILLLASLQASDPADSEPFNAWLQTMFETALDTALLSVFAAFGQAVIIHMAIQDIRRGPVRLVESLNVSLRRFWPLIGLAFADFLATMAYFLLIVPNLVLNTIWFVALPVCIVEQRGSWTSLRRSLELTKGHRWRVFGLVLLLLIPTFARWLVGFWLSADADPIVRAVGELIWGGVWTAFDAAVLVVTYRDLRVAKEGTDIEQIAVVFD